MSPSASGSSAATTTDPATAPGTSADPGTPTGSPSPTADQLAIRWTELWNGAYHLARELCTPDFRIRFAANGTAGDNTHPGDSLRGPAHFVDFLHDFHATHPGIRFALDGTAAGEVTPAGTGFFAARWYVDTPEGPSGIDMFDIRDGKIAEVWSVTGTRRFPTA
ncbi:nuclear transport factor 2 family protein [Nocardia sp. 2]|uniref:Nuclear transport factor 2 family protein n=1 Tax=Nocardia acididurans TaxID=2802282 RepID=A0ABS1ME02_9NOCA|nr:nuclear transport factor 2 family protein [Nocardia acididurans]MBL1078883.1 nuclear transport factor 2 family protein [Nocardia acididurans]